MTTKQRWTIALMCAVAALLAGALLWRQPATPDGAAHDSHADAHGHDDHQAQDTATGSTDAAPARSVAMSAAQAQASGIAIDTATPAALQERLHLPAQVKVDAERTVALAAPVPGLVQAALVSPGATVRKGQALVAIQSPAIAQWRADADIAAERLALARTVYAREKALWEAQVSARQDLDAADSALREAGIAARAARQRLAALGIAAAPGGAANVMSVRAPFDGVVVDKQAVAGQAVDDTRPLLTIADLSQVWIEAALPADSLARVGTGMPARVSVAAVPDPLDAQVSFVGPVLGEGTRMATARIALANPKRQLRPGMLASVDLLGPRADVSVTVRNEALQTIHEHTVVFVQTAAGFRAQDVVPGRSDGKRTEIVRGLAAGTPYAAGGSYLLKADLGKSEAEHED